jgi:hypothetical protein
MLYNRDSERQKKTNKGDRKMFYEIINLATICHFTEVSYETYETEEITITINTKDDIRMKYINKEAIENLLQFCEENCKEHQKAEEYDFMETFIFDDFEVVVYFV